MTSTKEDSMPRCGMCGEEKKTLKKAKLADGCTEQICETCADSCCEDCEVER